MSDREDHPRSTELEELEEENERLRVSAEGWQEEAKRSHQNVAWREARIEAALAIAEAIAEWDQDEHPEVYKDEFAYDRMVDSFKDAGARMVKALKGGE